MTGNTISLNVDGVTITQVFVTDHQATIDALAAQITTEIGVEIAVRIGDHIIEVKSISNGVPVLLNKITVTGGSETTRIEVRETKAGQAAAAFLQFG